MKGAESDDGSAPFIVGRTRRSDRKGGVDQGPRALQDDPVHDQAHAVWAMAGVRDVF